MVVSLTIKIILSKSKFDAYIDIVNAIVRINTFESWVFQHTTWYTQGNLVGDFRPEAANIYIYILGYGQNICCIYDF